LSPPIIGLIGILVFLFLALLGIPLGFAFTAVGVLGIIWLKGLGAGLLILGQAPYEWTASYILTTIPLFILMGQFAFQSGISTDLYRTAYKWMGRLPGGLALATMFACTGFAACTGSSLASAATMGTVAYPEMKRYHYSDRLSTGCIAVGGTLGILIPPSTIFIIYGIVTETSIGDLFIAGIIPGLMLASLFILLIYVMCRINPRLGPPAIETFSWKEKISSLRGVWGMLSIFILVIGGLYLGIFAPSEAGAIGAFGALFISLIRRRLSWSSGFSALKETAKTTSLILFVFVGAMIFNTFISISALSRLLTQFITSIPTSPMVILIIIIAFYLPLGMVIEGMSMVLLTMPFVFPVITQLGFDPVWFGVLLVVLVEVSFISPPIGINLFVVQGITKVPLHDVVLGIVPFVVAFVIGLVILVAFPQLSLFLPNLMH
jgi:tripartite ATP-independent transporter DctM subunit